MDWITAHWLDLLQNIAIVGGLVFTARTLAVDEKGRQVENMLRVAAEHRRIWELVFKFPELTRILHSDVDIEASPITEREEMFVEMLVLHLNLSIQANRKGLYILPEQLTRDVREFFALTIPAAVWKKSKLFQDAAFVAFVDGALKR